MSSTGEAGAILEPHGDVAVVRTLGGPTVGDVMRQHESIPLSKRPPGAAQRSFDGLAGVVEASLLDDVRLLTSEIVTNAVQHSGCPEGDQITVDTSLGEDDMRIEVLDQGAGVGPLLPRSSTPPSGLGYVHLLSDRWASVIVNSFQVWFEIDVTESSDGLFSRASTLTARLTSTDGHPVH